MSHAGLSPSLWASPAAPSRGGGGDDSREARGGDGDIVDTSVSLADAAVVGALNTTPSDKEGGHGSSDPSSGADVSGGFMGDVGGAGLPGFGGSGAATKPSGGRPRPSGPPPLPDDDPSVVVRKSGRVEGVLKQKAKSGEGLYLWIRYHFTLIAEDRVLEVRNVSVDSAFNEPERGAEPTRVSLAGLTGVQRKTPPERGSRFALLFEGRAPWELMAPSPAAADVWEAELTPLVQHPVRSQHPSAVASDAAAAVRGRMHVNLIDSSRSSTDDTGTTSHEERYAGRDGSGQVATARRELAHATQQLGEQQHATPPRVKRAVAAESPAAASVGDISLRAADAAIAAEAAANRPVVLLLAPHAQAAPAHSSGVDVSGGRGPAMYHMTGGAPHLPGSQAAPDFNAGWTDTSVEATGSGVLAEEEDLDASVSRILERSRLRRSQSAHSDAETAIERIAHAGANKGVGATSGGVNGRVVHPPPVPWSAGASKPASAPPAPKFNGGSGPVSSLIQQALLDLSDTSGDTDSMWSLGRASGGVQMPVGDAEPASTPAGDGVSPGKGQGRGRGRGRGGIRARGRKSRLRSGKTGPAAIRRGRATGTVVAGMVATAGAEGASGGGEDDSNDNFAVRVATDRLQRAGIASGSLIAALRRAEGRTATETVAGVIPRGVAPPEPPAANEDPEGQTGESERPPRKKRSAWSKALAGSKVVARRKRSKKKTSSTGSPRPPTVRSSPVSRGAQRRPVVKKSTTKLRRTGWSKAVSAARTARGSSSTKHATGSGTRKKRAGAVASAAATLTQLHAAGTQAAQRHEDAEARAAAAERDAVAAREAAAEAEAAAKRVSAEAEAGSAGAASLEGKESLGSTQPSGGGWRAALRAATSGVTEERVRVAQEAAAAAEAEAKMAEAEAQRAIAERDAAEQELSRTNAALAVANSGKRKTTSGAAGMASSSAAGPWHDEPAAAPPTSPGSDIADPGDGDAKSIDTESETDRRGGSQRLRRRFDAAKPTARHGKPPLRKKLLRRAAGRPDSHSAEPGVGAGSTEAEDLARQARAKAAARSRKRASSVQRQNKAQSRSPSRSPSPTIPRKAKDLVPCSATPREVGRTKEGATVPTTVAEPYAASPPRIRGRRQQASLLVSPSTARGRPSGAPQRATQRSGRHVDEPQPGDEVVLMTVDAHEVEMEADPGSTADADGKADAAEGAAPDLDPSAAAVGSASNGEKGGDSGEATATREAAGRASADVQSKPAGKEVPRRQQHADSESAAAADEPRASIKSTISELRKQAAAASPMSAETYEKQLAAVRQAAAMRERKLKAEAARATKQLIEEQRAVDAANAANLARLNAAHAAQIERFKRLLHEEGRRLEAARAEIGALSEARDQAAAAMHRAAVEGRTVPVADYEKVCKALAAAEAGRTAAEAVATRIGDRRRIERAEHNEAKAMLAEQKQEADELRRRAVVAERKASALVDKIQRDKAEVEALRKRTEQAEARAAEAQRQADRLGKYVYGQPQRLAKPRKRPALGMSTAENIGPAAARDGAADSAKPLKHDDQPARAASPSRTRDAHIKGRASTSVSQPRVRMGTGRPASTTPARGGSGYSAPPRTVDPAAGAVEGVASRPGATPGRQGEKHGEAPEPWRPTRSVHEGQYRNLYGRSRGRGRGAGRGRGVRRPVAGRLS